MRKTVIGELCKQINDTRHFVYPAKGYLYFADITGDGFNNKRVYTIVNDSGGVSAIHNGATYRGTAKNLRKVLSVQGVY